MSEPGDWRCELRTGVEPTCVLSRDWSRSREPSRAEEHKSSPSLISDLPSSSLSVVFHSGRAGKQLCLPLPCCCCFRRDVRADRGSRQPSLNAMTWSTDRVILRLGSACWCPWWLHEIKVGGKQTTTGNKNSFEKAGAISCCLLKFKLQWKWTFIYYCNEIK